MPPIKYLHTWFQQLLQECNEVYIIVRYSPDTRLGDRGFTVEEREHGIVLCFDRQSIPSTYWTPAHDLQTRLFFNSKEEQCFIHHNDIIAVYSPAGGVTMSRLEVEPTRENVQTSNIISINDYKSKKRKRI